MFLGLDWALVGAIVMALLIYKLLTSVVDGVMNNYDRARDKINRNMDEDDQ